LGPEGLEEGGEGVLYYVFVQNFCKKNYNQEKIQFFTSPKADFTICDFNEWLLEFSLILMSFVLDYKWFMITSVQKVYILLFRLQSMERDYNNSAREVIQLRSANDRLKAEKNSLEQVTIPIT